MITAARRRPVCDLAPLLACGGIAVAAAGTTYALASDGAGDSLLTETATPPASASAGLTRNVSRGIHTGKIAGTDALAAKVNDTIIANEATANITGGVGPMTFLGGRTQATVTAGSGGVAFTARTGHQTIEAGSGIGSTSLVNRLARGADPINDFMRGVDHLSLKGHNAAKINHAIGHAIVAGGSKAIGLPDATKLTFGGLTDIHRGSFLIG